MKDRALKLMTSCKHCTISSLGEDGKPQSAFVGFSEDKDFNLVIGTYRDSRKYKNISERPAVSIVVSELMTIVEQDMVDRKKLSHELADCLWSILVIARKLDVDIERAFWTTMGELDQKFEDGTA
jgi:NTP pyrophosphatase (non-canonical NTP hydrolase)